MQQIDKIVKSKYAPKDREVIWIDVNNKIPIVKVWNGTWQPITAPVSIESKYVFGDDNERAVFSIYANAYNNCGTLNGDASFELEDINDKSTVKHFFIVFDALDTYALDWPNNLSWINDEPLEETEEGKHYEVSILNGYASYASYSILEDIEEINFPVSPAPGDSE